MASVGAGVTTCSSMVPILASHICGRALGIDALSPAPEAFGNDRDQGRPRGQAQQAVMQRFLGAKPPSRRGSMQTWMQTWPALSDGMPVAAKIVSRPNAALYPSGGEEGSRRSEGIHPSTQRTSHATQGFIAPLLHLLTASAGDQGITPA